MRNPDAEPIILSGTEPEGPYVEVEINPDQVDDGEVVVLLGETGFCPDCEARFATDLINAIKAVWQQAYARDHAHHE